MKQERKEKEVGRRRNNDEKKRKVRKKRRMYYFIDFLFCFLVWVLLNNWAPGCISLNPTLTLLGKLSLSLFLNFFTTFSPVDLKYVWEVELRITFRKLSNEESYSIQLNNLVLNFSFLSFPRVF